MDKTDKGSNQLTELFCPKCGGQLVERIENSQVDDSGALFHYCLICGHKFFYRKAKEIENFVADPE